MAKKKKYITSLVFTSLLLLGFVGTRLVQSAPSANSKGQLADQMALLKQQLQQTATKEQAGLTKKRELEAKRLKLLNGLAQTPEDKEAIKELNLAQKLGGLTEVTGDGIVITLNDKPNYDSEKDSVLAIVHDRYLSSVLYGVINGGAEAVSINGVRIVANSTITCVGPVIMVDRVRLAPPYIVKAIGPQTKMREEIAKDALLNQVIAPEIGVVLKVSDSKVVIESYSGAIDLSGEKVN